MFEKIVHKHVFNFFRDNYILTSLQSGFVPGDSTVNQLVDLYNPSVKLLTMARKSVPYFAISVRLSIESGIEAYCIS